MLGASSNAPVGQAGAAPGNDMPVNGKRLVKDPVCGMHLAQELALPMNANGETQYFCSPECREKYESSVLRRPRTPEPQSESRTKMTLERKI